MFDLPREWPSVPGAISPKVEVEENENNVVVSAEMPGIPENNIDLEVSSDGYLTISGEKSRKKGKPQGKLFF